MILCSEVVDVEIVTRFLIVLLLDVDFLFLPFVSGRLFVPSINVGGDDAPRNGVSAP